MNIATIPRRHVLGLAATCIACAARPLLGADAAEPPAADMPKLQWIYTATVNISPIEQVGPVRAVTQRIIPITGGTFEGLGIKGTIVPGSADWNLLRADGSSTAEAYYFMRTDDGVVIKVLNRAVIPAPKKGAPPPSGRLTVTSPVFEAPQGKYEGLNDGVHVGTLSVKPGGGAVIIRVYRVL
jgi:hypothetical protein